MFCIEIWQTQVPVRMNSNNFGDPTATSQAPSDQVKISICPCKTNNNLIG